MCAWDICIILHANILDNCASKRPMSKRVSIVVLPISYVYSVPQGCFISMNPIILQDKVWQGLFSINIECITTKNVYTCKLHRVGDR